MITQQSFVADQLRAISPGINWSVAGIDRANELASILVRNGIVNLWELQLVKSSELVAKTQTRWQQENGIDPGTEVIDGFAFSYHGKQFGFLGSPNEVANEKLFHRSNKGIEVAWSADGHGNVGYVLSKNAQTNKLQFEPIWGSSSDAGDLREMLTTSVALLAFTFLPMAGINIGASIGSAILPSSLTVAYPAVSAAIGNIALSTALTGGNVESAVKGAVISSFAGGVGQASQAVTNSALIGSLASAATGAAISGGDVKSAVGIAALTSGASNMSDWFEINTQPVAPNPYGNEWGDPFANMDFAIPTENVFNTGFPIAASPLDFSFGTDFVPITDFFAVEDIFGQGEQVQITDVFDLTDVDLFGTGMANAFVDSQVPVIQTSVPPASSPVFKPSEIVQQITAAALATISVIKAYKSLDAPVLQTTARVVRPDGSVSVVGNNGLIQTKKPDGGVIATKPPVGVPQATTSGNYIVNNGDGTYTVVSPTGDSRTLQYEDGGFNLSPTLVIGGAAAALFLLLRK